MTHHGVTMKNPVSLDLCYKKYMGDLYQWLPDGFTTIDLEVLQQLDLLHFHETVHVDSGVTRYFHVVESDEKLTLVNEEFVIWIVPEKGENDGCTYTLIARNSQDDLHLELGFITKGIYNRSHLVLQIIEKYLLEIHATEALLKKLS